MNISLLDCTLRDGAHVNKGIFGVSAICNTLEALENSKIEMIEVGFLRNIKYQVGSSVFENINDFEDLLERKINAEISLMIRPDQCDINKLYKKSNFVDRLRFAFYKKDMGITREFVLRAHKLGYKIGLNPINIGMYSLVEIKSILKNIEDLPVDCVAIVDTFGMLKKNRFREICDLFDQCLPKSIAIGIHLHENLSLSFGLVCDYLEFGNNNRNIVVDSALLGMGRIPGNLCTEIMVQHLMEQYDKDYKLSPILQVISQEIEPIKQRTPWGYSPMYLLSAVKCVHRDYGEFLSNKKVAYHLGNEILDEIRESGKSLVYDEEFIRDILIKRGIL